jgi:DNA-binding MarR family transcriptional regulator
VEGINSTLDVPTRPPGALRAAAQSWLCCQRLGGMLSAMAMTMMHELSATELAAWRGMLRAQAAVVRALDTELEQAHNLPLTHYDVLIHLRSAPGRRLRMAELADSVLLSRSGVTRLVDRLEREGLLERDICSSDGRGCFAVLTDRGEELVARARPTHLAGVRRRFLSHFSEDELAVMAEGWNRVHPGAADVTPAG